MLNNNITRKKTKMDSKKLLRFADACLEEAKLQAEYHARLANNYRIIATKTKMLKDSVWNLEDTKRRFEQEQAILNEMKNVPAEVTSPGEVVNVLYGDRGALSEFDFSEFDT